MPRRNGTGGTFSHFKNVEYELSNVKLDDNELHRTLNFGNSGGIRAPKWSIENLPLICFNI